MNQQAVVSALVSAALTIATAYGVAVKPAQDRADSATVGLDLAQQLLAEKETTLAKREAQLERRENKIEALKARLEACQ